MWVNVCTSVCVFVGDKLLSTPVRQTGEGVVRGNVCICIVTVVPLLLNYWDGCSASTASCLYAWM